MTCLRLLHALGVLELGGLLLHPGGGGGVEDLGNPATFLLADKQRPRLVSFILIVLFKLSG